MYESKVLGFDMLASAEHPYDDINECSTSLIRQPAKGTFNTFNTLFISSTVIELVSGLTKAFQCQLQPK